MNDVLKDGGRAGSATVRARRMTGGLLIAQLALTVILLTGAGLMIRTYFSLYLTDLVLDTRGVVTMRVVLPAQKYVSRVEQQQFVETLHERLRGLPVFASVGLGSDIPFHPLGTRSLPNFMPDRHEEAVAYLPMRADPAQLRAVSILVRSADPTAGKTASAATLREHVSAIDVDLPVFGIQTLDEAAALARVPSRLVATWFITIALVALILASVGLYALTAHGVAQRAQEIGVRMALGAQAEQVVWLFVRRTLLQLVIGLALGIAGALAVGKLLSTFLRDTDPRDPITLALVSVLLVAVALIASVWPARKAARVDPVVALRAE